MTKPNDVDRAPVHDVVLLPCPFCGSSDVGFHEDDYGFARWVICGTCEADGPLLAVQPGTKEAAKLGVSRMWNRRDGDPCREGCKIKRWVKETQDSLTADYESGQ